MSDANWKVAAERDLMSLGGRPRLFESGSGSYVTDDAGREHLDFLGGIAVNSLGHAHPVFVSAVAEQAAKLAHVSNLFASQPQLDLAARLKRLAGTGEDGRVFLANAGSEANETALKLARLHGNPRGKTAILSLAGAFHGRSIGALSITPKAAYQDPFAPLLPDTRTIEPTLDALEHAFAADDVAAIFIEPIQGEAGVRELPDGFLARARELTRRHDALLILDEVQTGSGRTGEWFAFQLPGMLPDGELPDAVTFAKAVGARFPLGGLITFGRASDLFAPGMHNSTFGGDPSGEPRRRSSARPRRGRRTARERDPPRCAAARGGLRTAGCLGHTRGWTAHRHRSGAADRRRRGRTRARRRSDRERAGT